MIDLIEEKLSEYKIREALDIYEKLEHDPKIALLLRMNYERILGEFISGTSSKSEQEVAENGLVDRLKTRLDLLRQRMV